MKFASKLIHNGNGIDKTTGAMSIPIYQVSTFNQEDINVPQDYEYSRSENPTRKALEQTIAFLEGGVRGFAFSSGMAATASVLSIFASGDHLVVCQDVYGGTYRICNTYFQRFGLEVTFVDATKLEEISKAIKPNTKGIFIETPSNPMMKITDIRGVAAIAREKNLITMIDNTFMSPYLQRPIELGIDIVIHSATKFIGGHSDVIAGLVVASNNTLANRIYAVQNGFGAILGPQDSWLLMRGIKTLKVRLDYQQESALKMAEFLSKHPQVDEVLYPGLKSNSGYALNKSQSDGSGGVLSFTFKKTEVLEHFLKNIKLASVAVSLGGVETIVSYPVKMSHASIPFAVRETLGISDKLIRVSLGLEDISDLIKDFEKSIDN
ncbi:MAG: PLP-dependent aspartate aminotransferase family protein [Bacillota bacterium]